MAKYDSKSKQSSKEIKLSSTVPKLSSPVSLHSPSHVV